MIGGSEWRTLRIDAPSPTCDTYLYLFIIREYLPSRHKWWTELAERLQEFGPRTEWPSPKAYEDTRIEAVILEGQCMADLLALFRSAPQSEVQAYGNLRRTIEYLEKANRPARVFIFAYRQ